MRQAVLLIATAAAVSANFTNYGALIPSLRAGSTCPIECRARCAR